MVQQGVQHGVLSPERIAEAVAQVPLLLEAHQAQQLADYAALLVRWNATYNLTALAAPEQILTHHLLDSLAVMPTLQGLFPRGAAKVLDVGSGGGLPGMVLAVVLPHWHFTLIDKVGKKTAFLNQVRAELGLKNVEVVHGRVENQRAHDYNLIISRAFASVLDFVRLTRAALAPGGRWVAMKGALETEDSAAIAAEVQVEQIVKLRVPRLDAERHLLVLRPR